MPVLIQHCDKGNCALWYTLCNIPIPIIAIVINCYLKKICILQKISDNVTLNTFK